MVKGEDLTEEQMLDLIVLIMERNGGSIDRQQLLSETEFFEQELDDLMEILALRGLIIFAHGSQLVGTPNMEVWMLARLTEEGAIRAKEFEKRG